MEPRDRDDLRREGMGEPAGPAAGPANTPPLGARPAAGEGYGGGSGFGAGTGTGTAPSSTSTPAGGPTGTDRPEPLTERGTYGRTATEDRPAERGGPAGGQVEDRINQAMDRAAGGLESAARRLGEVADRQAAGATGRRARAGEMAHGAADSLETAARYLRDNDAQALRSDVERMVRERPMQTLLIGVAAGWVLGKVLR